MGFIDDWKKNQQNKSFDNMNEKHLRDLSESVASYRTSVDVEIAVWRIEKLIKQLGFEEELTLDDVVKSNINNFTFDDLDDLMFKKRG